MIQGFFREPLLHFALIGGLLFAVLSGSSARDQEISREIIVTQGQIASLAQNWQRTRQRPPTPEELEAIIADYVREEIFYREARAMGLDENDSVIRRRLRQKLEFLAEDFAAMTQPNQAQLQAYLDENLERYVIEPRLSFRHIFISQDKRGADATAHAEQLLSLLEDGDTHLSPEDLGDPLPLPSQLDDVSISEVARTFGDAFADGVRGLPTGSWQGPIPSAFGVHLVFVSGHEPARKPALADVRDAVRRDWLAEQQRQARETFYGSLRDLYDVRFEAANEPAAAAAKRSVSAS